MLPAPCAGFPTAPTAFVFCGQRVLLAPPLAPPSQPHQGALGALRHSSAPPPAVDVIQRAVGRLTAFEGPCTPLEPPWSPHTWLSTPVFPVLSIASVCPAYRMGLRCAFPVVLLSSSLMSL